MYAKGTAVAGPYTYDPLRGATYIDPGTRERRNTMDPDSRKINQRILIICILRKFNLTAITKGHSGN